VAEQYSTTSISHTEHIMKLFTMLLSCNSKVGIFSCTNVIFADQKHLTRNCQVAVVWLYGVLLVQKKMEKYEEIRWNLM